MRDGSRLPCVQPATEVSLRSEGQPSILPACGITLMNSASAGGGVDTMCGIGVHETAFASISQKWQELPRNSPPISISMDLPRTLGSTSPHSQTKRKLCDLCRVVRIDGFCFGKSKKWCENALMSRERGIVAFASPERLNATAHDTGATCAKGLPQWQ